MRVNGLQCTKREYKSELIAAITKAVSNSLHLLLFSPLFLPILCKQHRWGGEEQPIQTGTLRGHKQVRQKHLCMVRKIPLLPWTISEVLETMETNINVASALCILSLKQ